jgi:hypothetical protein
MKRLRQICAVTILTVSVTLSAFAGNINCGAVEPPPPETPSSVTGEMATGATATNETTYVDPVTGLALDILQSLLALF